MTIGIVWQIVIYLVVTLLLVAGLFPMILVSMLWEEDYPDYGFFGTDDEY